MGTAAPHHADEIAHYYRLMRWAFGTFARVYDAVALFVAPLRPRAVTFAEVPAGARVLDVATGTGSQALAFARRGYEVVGVDLVDEMLAVARRKRDAERVRFEQMDATELAFPAAAFDLVTISFGLHEMPAAVRDKVVAEMARRVPVVRRVRRRRSPGVPRARRGEARDGRARGVPAGPGVPRVNQREDRPAGESNMRHNVAH